MTIYGGSADENKRAVPLLSVLSPTCDIEGVWSIILQRSITPRRNYPLNWNLSPSWFFMRLFKRVVRFLRVATSISSGGLNWRQCWSSEFLSSLVMDSESCTLQDTLTIYHWQIMIIFNCINFLENHNHLEKNLYSSNSYFFLAYQFASFFGLKRPQKARMPQNFIVWELEGGVSRIGFCLD